MAPCHGWGGMREEKVHLAVLREYYWSVPSWKAAEEKGLVSGVIIIVFGRLWGSRGSLMANTWRLATGEVGWEKKRCFWQLWESITGPYPPRKLLRKRGSFWEWILLLGGSDGGPEGPWWPIHGPSPRLRWDERRKGAFGSFERVLLVVREGSIFSISKKNEC